MKLESTRRYRSVPKSEYVDSGCGTRSVGKSDRVAVDESKMPPTPLWVAAGKVLQSAIGTPEAVACIQRFNLLAGRKR